MNSPESDIQPSVPEPWSRRPGAVIFLVLLALSALMLVAAAANDPIVLDRIDAAGRRESVPDRRLDMNRASAAEMEALPLIGPALAGRIVADRELNGPFESIEDLRRVNGIGPRIILIIEPHVCVRDWSRG